MASKRYAVINKNGLVVNHVLIDDPMPRDYYPGYGQRLLCLDGAPNLTNSAGLQVLLGITPNRTPQIGDTINISNGQVTKFVPQLIQVRNELNVLVWVATGPTVKLERDVAPTRSGG